MPAYLDSVATSDVLEYIEEMAAELAAMAGNSGDGRLSHLLKAASLCCAELREEHLLSSADGQLDLVLMSNGNIF